ncbi:MAG: carbamate kinase [Candidatus Marinimicrobia bacterium]|jgi:carbamate kinase|nr:carbamate kinase [Candidatus Neomarinimicrobiota bacterium]
MAKTVLIALGGNALSPKGERGDIHQQFSHTRDSLSKIMEFVRQDYNICLTHGNGPQVGDELHRMDMTHEVIPPLPLGVCVAGTQGTIGYMIQQSFQNALRKEKIDREVVTLVTQVRIDENDPSIENPTKFIGKRYSEKEAQQLGIKFGWRIKEQESGNWRRVVPSPDPVYILHGNSIRTLVERGTIVLAAGGGGIPVYNDSQHNLEGLDAVIDKDLTAAKLGWIVRADEYYIITDVDKVYLNYKQEKQEPIHQMSVSEAEKYKNQGQFQKGSMGPKMRSALYFLEHGGKKAVITNVENIKQAIEGKAGTTILK